MTERPRGTAPSRPPAEVKRRWRDYKTPAGSRPVKSFIQKQSEADQASILAAMTEVRQEGLRRARHLRGEIYEVRADGDRVIYRILFAQEGTRGRVLLALVAIKKKTQRTPPQTIALAERRLALWRKKPGQGRAPAKRSKARKQR